MYICSSIKHKHEHAPAWLNATDMTYILLKSAILVIQATQHARETLEAVAHAGKLGPAGQGAHVIYAQTDSIFASFPAATTQQALELGRLAGELVSAAFPPVMDLKFERVCQPFMMLHVNRYALEQGCNSFASLVDI